VPALAPFSGAIRAPEPGTLRAPGALDYRVRCVCGWALQRRAPPHPPGLGPAFGLARAQRARGPRPAPRARSARSRYARRPRPARHRRPVLGRLRAPCSPQVALRKPGAPRRRARPVGLRPAHRVSSAGSARPLGAVALRPSPLGPRASAAGRAPAARGVRASLASPRAGGAGALLARPRHPAPRPLAVGVPPPPALSRGPLPCSGPRLRRPKRPPHAHRARARPARALRPVGLPAEDGRRLAPALTVRGDYQDPDPDTDPNEDPDEDRTRSVVRARVCRRKECFSLRPRRLRLREKRVLRRRRTPSQRRQTRPGPTPNRSGVELVDQARRSAARAFKRRNQRRHNLRHDVRWCLPSTVRRRWQMP